MISDRRLCELCWEAYRGTCTFDDGATHFNVTQESEFTVIAFRGTLDPIEWARNFFFRSFLSKVHVGFSLSSEKAWPLIPSAGKVVLTGHSAGGAIAQLVAAKFASAGRSPAKLTTFGSPRVLRTIHDGMIDLLRNVPGYDYRNMDDPVPNLPATFHSPRDIKQIGEPSTLRISIEDHMMAAYYEAIKSLE